MEDVEIVIDPEEGAAPPPEAPEEEPAAAPAEEEPEARAAAPATPSFNPTDYYRQRVEERRQRAEQARTTEIQRRMAELSQQKPADKPAAAPAPDREKDPEAWALHQIRTAAKEAIEAQLAPLLASREEDQRQQFTQQAQVAQVQEQIREIAHLADVQEHHYPGYRERLAAWEDGMRRSGQDPDAFKMMVLQYSRGQNLNPVHELDVAISERLGSWGWKPKGQQDADAKARKEVAETKAALASPTAKSIGSAPRAQGAHGRITGASLAKVARTNGGKVSRGQMVAAAKSRLTEVNGNFSAALDLIMREVQAAERKSA